MNQNIVAARTVTTMKAAIAHFLKCIVWLLVWKFVGLVGKVRCAEWQDINGSNVLPVRSVLVPVAVGQLLSVSPVNCFFC
jgi:hypothetical protein